MLHNNTETFNSIKNLKYQIENEFIQVENISIQTHPVSSDTYYIKIPTQRITKGPNFNPAGNSGGNSGGNPARKTWMSGMTVQNTHKFGNINSGVDSVRKTLDDFNKVGR